MHAIGRFLSRSKLAATACGILLGAGSIALAGPGDLDPTFGANGDGRVLEPLSSTAPTGLAVLQTTGGKLVVAGTTGTATGSGTASTSNMVIARFNADGTADTTFNAGSGAQAISFPAAVGGAYAIIQDPDGKLVAAGNGRSVYGRTDVAIARLNADGSLDTTFGQAGVFAISGGGSDSYAAGVVRQSDGKYVTAGATNSGAGGSYDFEFLRFNTDGSIDKSFGSANNGAVIIDFSGSTDQANAMVQQPDGAIVAAGLTTDSSGKTSMAVVRIGTNGALDTSFGTNGKAVVSFDTSAAAAAIALQPDGKFVLAGVARESSTSSLTNSVLARLNANGTLDTTFGTGGKVTTDFGGKDYLTALALDPAGRILVTGQMQRDGSNSLTDIIFARFTAAGALDTTFGIGGKTIVDCGDAAIASQCQAYGLVRQGDGNVVAVGHETAGGRLVLARAAITGGYAGNLGFALNAQTVNENAGVVNVVVRRTGGQTGAVSVPYTITDIDTTAGQDYTAAATGTLNWADGDSADKIIPITIIDDAQPEFTESLSIQLGATTTGGAGLTTTTHVLSIADNDTSTNGSLQFTVRKLTTLESAGNITLAVGRLGGSTGAVSVQYATADGTAKAGTRYTATSGTLNWAAGDIASKTITIPIINDTITQAPDEFFSIALSNATGGATIGQNGSVAIDLQDDDQPGTLAFATATTSVQRSTGTVSLTVGRTIGSKGAVTVNYSTVSGTAIAGTDFASTSGTLSWADADVAVKTITVPLLISDQPTAATKFSVVLSGPTGGAVIGTLGTATVKIPASGSRGTLQFAQTAYTVAESAGTLTLTVNRANGSTGAISVQYATVDGTAKAGSDYTAASGTLTWADGDYAAKTFTVTITNDTTPESSENFTVVLSNPTGNVTLDPASSTATVTITDDDPTNPGKSGGGGGCFIATAAFGTPMAHEVDVLRRFRDHWLLQRDWGRHFVAWYYEHSPPVADFIRERPWLRAVVRTLLQPLIWIANRIESRSAPQPSETNAAAAGGMTAAAAAPATSRDPSPLQRTLDAVSVPAAPRSASRQAG